MPHVSDPLALGDALHALAAGALRCLLAADGGESLAAFAARPGTASVVLLIGPEGGLADNEQKFAQANGFVACRPDIGVGRTPGREAQRVVDHPGSDLVIARQPW